MREILKRKEELSEKDSLLMDSDVLHQDGIKNQFGADLDILITFSSPMYYLSLP